jgi:lysophospholipase L1-like esterase
MLARYGVVVLVSAMFRALIWTLAAVLLATQADAHEHSEVRQFVIRSQLQQAGAGAVVVIGDSITESALLPSEICGRRVINAGIGGFTAGDYLPFAKQIMPTAGAVLTVVAIGTNEAYKGATPQPSYGELIDLIRQHSEKVILAGIPPFDMSGELAKAYFEPASGDAVDDSIRHSAMTRNLPFVDLRHDINGEKLTIDGIHLNAAGYAQWRAALLSRIRSSLGCAAGSN